MSDIETGGPAFPTAADNGHSANQDGMTLRDYFAAKAMHATMVTPADTENHAESSDWALSMAKMAYRVADAMLRARQQAGRG